MSDVVNSPSHYADGTSIECIDSMMAVLGIDGLIYFCLGNAYKYMWRHKLKGKPEEDLAKAKWYIDKAYGLMEYCDNAVLFCDIVSPLSIMYESYAVKNDLDNIKWFEKEDKNDAKQTEGTGNPNGFAAIGQLANGAVKNIFGVNNETKENS